MAFNPYEDSDFQGRPISLYEFSRTSEGGAETVYFRYNSSENDIHHPTLGSFTAIPISDDGVRESGETTSSDFQVTLPVESPVVEMLRASGAVPSDVIYLTVWRIHFDDPDLEPRVYWKGTVTGSTQADEIGVRITAATLVSSFRRGGLRLAWGPQCPYSVYDPHTCKVDKELFKTTAVLGSVDGIAVDSATFATKPVGWFSGGYIEYLLSSGIIERRLVVNHNGSSLTLNDSPIGLTAGMTVQAYAGDDKAITTCRDKFNNLPNYGGFVHIPSRSPYDGSPVY